MIYQIVYTRPFTRETNKLGNEPEKFINGHIDVVFYSDESPKKDNGIISFTDKATSKEICISGNFLIREITEEEFDEQVKGVQEKEATQTELPLK